MLELIDTKANKAAVAPAPGPATQANQAAPTGGNYYSPAPSANYSTYNSTPVLANGNTAVETRCTHAAAHAWLS